MIRKKIVVRDEKNLYIKKDSDGYYCDFCGEHNKSMFESEFECKQDQSCACMQICYDCVEQLYKLLD